MVKENGSVEPEHGTNGHHSDDGVGDEEIATNGDNGDDHSELDGSLASASEADDSETEGNAEAEAAGDAEYELNREEPSSPSAHDWKVILMKAEFAEELCEQIRKMKPYERCQRTGRIIPTKSLRDLVQGFCMFLDCGTKIAMKIMKNLTKDVFARCDLLFEISRILPDRLQRFSKDAVSTWFNVFHFLKFVPDPRVSVTPRVFNVVHHPLKAHKKKKLVRMFQENWIGLMMCTIPPKVLSVMIPYLTENVLDSLDEPHRTADFFFRTFDKGDMFAILSLGAIFKLIVAHNFEYPNFYDHVYSLTKPSVLYLDQKEKFISLLDKFLSSTHIPNYVVAGFAKRLSRMLLLAPVDAQEPVLGLIRNLLTRHPNVSCLIHRDVPETLSSDPYDENEPSLSKCNALNSSLWEIKSLQKHWHQNVAKRASFVDKKLQQMESFVRFRCQDEIFSNMMAKSFGNAEGSMEEKYSRAQDGSDDEELPAKKKMQKRGKFARKHEEHKEHAIPINFTAPTGQLFPENSFNLMYEKFWCA
ncbi:CBF/Mak21 family protein [Ancylostoma caninum]|uniref:CBF/Mak21 family protein n=1 Tax=Ancylostoma caninum TaxID=29170 RepID=A0A368FR24_ANCCA|nr:CBF/Mak21 family protein [Ancylostoma caninum]